MTIEFNVSESSAEYLRIRIARSTDAEEVKELREQLSVLEKELLKQHKKLVAEHNRRKK